MSHQGYFNESMRNTGDIDTVRSFVCCVVRAHMDECFIIWLGRAWSCIGHWGWGGLPVAEKRARRLPFCVWMATYMRVLWRYGLCIRDCCDDFCDCDVRL